MKTKMINNKIKDYIYSILASSLPLAMMQLLIIPFYSKKASNIEFGNFILTLTIVTMLSTILGNTLNNIRLSKKESIHNEIKYINFLIILIIIQQIILSIYLFINEYTLNNILIISLWASLLLIKTYLLVYYRIKINYRSYLLSSIINLVFLFMSFTIYYNDIISIYTVYFIGELATVIFIVYNQKIYIIDRYLTIISKNDIKNYFYLFVSNMLNNILIYADRIIVGLFLGKKHIALIFIVTSLPKLTSLIINPIANVLLSYEVNNTNEKRHINLKKVIEFILLIFISSIVISFCSYIFIYIFYNDYLDRTKNLIYLASLGVILFSTSSFTQVKLIASNNFITILWAAALPLIILIASSWIILPIYEIYGFLCLFIFTAVIKHIILIFFANERKPKV